MESKEPTVDDYLKWYKEGYITICPLFIGNQILLIAIPINIQNK